MLRYPIVVMPDDNGTLLVTCPDLPEVTTFGDDETDAAVRASDAIATAVQARIAGRLDVPEPSAIDGPFAVLTVSDAFKIELYRAMRTDGVGKADLARRLGCHLPQIDRLLDLSHSSKIGALENALRAVGREVGLVVSKAA